MCMCMCMCMCMYVLVHALLWVNAGRAAMNVGDRPYAVENATVEKQLLDTWMVTLTLNPNPNPQP